MSRFPDGEGSDQSSPYRRSGVSLAWLSGRSVLLLLVREAWLYSELKALRCRECSAPPFCQLVNLLYWLVCCVAVNHSLSSGVLFRTHTCRIWGQQCT